LIGIGIINKENPTIKKYLMKKSFLNNEKIFALIVLLSKTKVSENKPNKINSPTVAEEFFILDKQSNLGI
jgi:hypothetical protein